MIKIFGKSYITERAKNLATKQDMEEITAKIEGIKVGYSAQIENLRATLLQGVNRNHLFLQKSTDLLLGFYDKLLVLNHDKLSKDLGDLYPDENNDVMKAVVAYFIETDNLFKALQIDYNRLVIFMNGQQKIMDMAKEIVLTTTLLKGILDKHSGKRKAAIYHEQEAYKTKDNQKINDAIDKNDRVTLEFSKEIVPYRDRLDQQVGAFISALMDYLQVRK